MMSVGRMQARFQGDSHNDGIVREHFSRKRSGPAIGLTQIDHPKNVACGSDCVVKTPLDCPPMGLRRTLFSTASTVLRPASLLGAGSEAPVLDLDDHLGQRVRSDDLNGQKHYVLIFYPGDDTPGCTKQLHDFDALRERFIHHGRGKTIAIDFDEGGQVRRLKRRRPNVQIVLGLGIGAGQGVRGHEASVRRDKERKEQEARQEVHHCCDSKLGEETETIWRPKVGHRIP